MDGGFGSQSSNRKNTEWSPINRMLMQKRGSRGPSPKRELPPLPPSPPAAPQKTSSSAQTITWPVLEAEAAAPERSRGNALDREVKSLKAELKACKQDVSRLREDAGSAQAQALEEAEQQRRELERELAALRQAKADVDAARAEDERRFDEERRRWEEQRSRFLEDGRQWEEERQAQQAQSKQLGRVLAELEQSKVDHGELRVSYKDLQEQMRALGMERDVLLERLETEQAEMMARVEKLERGASSRQPTRSFSNTLNTNLNTSSGIVA